MLPYLFFSLFISLVPFSIALSSSVYRCIEWKEGLRIALTFAVFQTVMIAFGWVIGFAMDRLMHDISFPVGVMIVVFIGLRMFADARKPGREHRIIADENRRILLGFAMVISINTALLGIGLGLLGLKVHFLSGSFLVMTFLMTVLGIQAGKKAMMSLGRTMEFIGASGLFIMCVVMVLQYLKIL